MRYVFRMTLVTGLPLAHPTECGIIYLANLGIPRNLFKAEFTNGLYVFLVKLSLCQICISFLYFVYLFLVFLSPSLFFLSHTHINLKNTNYLSTNIFSLLETHFFLSVIDSYFRSFLIITFGNPDYRRSASSTSPPSAPSLSSPSILSSPDVSQADLYLLNALIYLEETGLLHVQEAMSNFHCIPTI